MTPTLSPHVVFHFVVEAEGLCPAEALADGLDDLQNVGSDGAVCTVVAVVARAPKVADQGVLDIALQVVGHVVIEGLLHAQRHADGGGVAVVYAVAVSGVLVHRVLALDDVFFRVGIGTEFPTQTALVQGTLFDVTYQVVAGFLSELCFVKVHLLSIVYMLQRYKLLVRNGTFLLKNVCVTAKFFF